MPTREALNRRATGTPRKRPMPRKNRETGQWLVTLARTLILPTISSLRSRSPPYLGERTPLPQTGASRRRERQGRRNGAAVLHKSKRNSTILLGRPPNN